MIYDVYRVGKAISGFGDTEMDPMLLPDTPKNITNVIWLRFAKEGSEVNYKGVEVLDYNQDNPEKYLLRKASANGANYGPCAQLTEVDKTLVKKIAQWFKDAGTDTEDSEGALFFLGIYEYIIIHKDELVTEISTIMPKGKGVQNIICIKLDEQYPLDVDIVFDYYSKKIRRKIIGKDSHTGSCCLCGKKNVSLLPKVEVFKFYTTDKPGFINGGFSEENIWRNCPVCISCEPILREGKKYVLNNLQYKFFGHDYYLIPSSTCNEDMQELLVDKLEGIKNKSFSFKETANDEFSSLSGDIFEELAEEDDINSYRILFFKKDHAAERIILDIKDIFPSRFAALYAGKYVVDGIYEELVGEKFSFRYFRYYLSKTEPSSKTYDLDSDFLTLTQAIFMKETILLNTLLPHYMRNIRRAFLKDDHVYHTTLRAWIGIKYLQEIGCIHNNKGEASMDEKLEKILEPYDIGLDTKNTKIKKALVLTGALAQKVMNIQSEELNGSTPFFTRLKGLKLRSTDVKGLLSEAFEKMNAYNSYSNASRLIMENTMELIFESEPVWNLSTDEINFYIAGGMALSKKIYGGLKEEKVCQQQNEAK